MIIKNKYENFLGGMHSIRGIAALAIIAFHLAPVGKIAMPGQLRFISLYFGSAVLMFFVISGFSLYYSTLPKVGKEGWMKTFYARRFFRIAPLFYTMLLVYVLERYFFWDGRVAWSSLLVNVTFLYNFFPGKHESMVMAGWPVGIEMIFYCIVPILLVTVSSWKRALLSTVLFAFISAYTMNYFNNPDIYPSSYAYMHFLTQAVAIVIGILVYHIYSAKLLSFRFSGHIWLVMSAVFFLLMLYGGRNSQTFRDSKVLLIALSCGAGLLSQLHSPIKIITNKTAINLGELSYSIYLAHPFIVVKMRPVYAYVSERMPALQAYIVCYLLTLLIVIPVAVMVYNLIEIKGVNLGRRLMKYL